jgi:hypothetical protein
VPACNPGLCRTIANKLFTDMVPYSKAHLKVSLSHDIPSGWASSTISQSKSLYGQTEGAQALIQYGNLPEYSVYFLHLRSVLKENMLFVRNKPVFFLVVQLRNTLDALVPGFPPIRLLEWSFNFLYAPVFELDIHMKEGSEYETFFLIVPEAFILYFGKQHEMVRTFHQRTKEKSPQSLLPNPKICPLAIMQQIIQLKVQGMQSLNLPFAEEFLSAIFESASSLPYRKVQYEDQVIDRLYALKAFLQEHPDNPLTRTELIARFRLTTQQFNQGFASIYNFTPFGFLKYLKVQM